ncbi:MULTISPECIES: hypothetical protein [Flammeovirga]|uniref:Lipocalin-like domain-containing protein n=1 Tax=Flammeovirga agarivorans TaxID=2726742 RepID=A0A7X8SRB5_9BACT|nr:MULTISPECIES: hypothetical protein [Flammeovirga]NLR94837.1 hypothetical protein [Flammeovirga agarivorans]
MIRSKLAFITVALLLFLSCQNVNKTSYPKELIATWTVSEIQDKQVTLINHGEDLPAKRGGRNIYEILKKGKLNRTTLGSNDKPIQESGVWSFNSKEQMLTFVVNDESTQYYVQLLTNDKLELKQTGE